MTGYGLAFPLNSKHKAKFNEKLLEYRFEYFDDCDYDYYDYDYDDFPINKAKVNEKLLEYRFDDCDYDYDNYHDDFIIIWWSQGQC